MKLTKLTLENYRSFKGKHEIEFAPITLLFGANSAGKSSVIKAIKGFSELSINDAFHGENEVSIALTFDVDRNFEKIFNVYEMKQLLKKVDLQNNEELINEYLRLTKLIKSFKIEVRLKKKKIYFSDVYLSENLTSTSDHFYEVIAENKVYLNDELFILHKNCDSPIYVDAYAIFEELGLIFNSHHSLFNFSRYKDAYQHIENELLGKKGEKKGYISYLAAEAFFNSLADLDNYYNSLVNEINNISFEGYLETSSLFPLILMLSRELFLNTNLFGFRMEHLGPLRKIPNKDYNIKQKVYFVALNDFHATSANYNELKNYYLSKDKLGDYIWKNIDRYINNVNNWLQNWFHTPYLIDLHKNYTFEVSGVEKQRLVDSGSIPSEFLTYKDSSLRIKNIFNKSITSAEEIGVGISQLTPVIVSALASSAFSVEQPELHIHPRMQTVVGDLFIFEGLFEDAEAGDEDAVAVTVKNLDGEDVTYYFKEKAQEDKSFILCETHSEHLLLRLLKRVRQGILNPDDLAITYVESNRGESKATRIGVGEEGDFTNQWPDGFFEERLEELF